MRILVCGCDGYIGYPLTQNLLIRGHKVFGVDCFHRRKMVMERGLESIIPIAHWYHRAKALEKLGDFQYETLDISKDYSKLSKIFRDFRPEAIVNLAQQPSAPYSMIDPAHASFTIRNNVQGALNLFWAMRDYAPESHVVTLGTMGEYGCPNMPIPEGFFEVEYENMTDILPFPRQTNSVYHTSKVMTSDLAWFASRVWELRITDIMQGVVYGTRTETMTAPVYRTRFDVGECFGTMINRAVSCAVINHPIIVYGSGFQRRAYIQLQDSITCLTLVTENHPTDEDSIHGYRVINQFDEYYSCQEIAEIVKKVAEEHFNLNVEVVNIENPRIEPEVHYYNPHHEKLYKMGWKPKKTIEEGLIEMFEDLIPFKERLLFYKDKINPRIKWRPDHVAIKGVKEVVVHGRKS